MPRPDLTVIAGGKDEPRVDSRDLARQLGNQHRPVMALIDRYADKFKRFGKLLFQKAPSTESRTGQRERYALLNEDQAFYLLSLSRNTEHIAELKAKLVVAFRQARDAQQVTELEYLPGYHELHDRAHELADGSPNERFVHMNLNKLVNKTVGIQPGQRPKLSAPVKSLTVAAQTVALRAMESANDHHDGYAAAKQALGNFGQLLLGGKK